MIDRKKDVIISGGVNIFPTEVEQELVQHPSIEDVAIVGIPHTEWGETAKAFVVLNEPVDDLESSCKAFLDGRVADYKIPKLFAEVEALPRNATGKLLRNQLRDSAEEMTSN